jgi:hypothetical protein
MNILLAPLESCFAVAIPRKNKRPACRFEPGVTNEQANAVLTVKGRELNIEAQSVQLLATVNKK